MVSLKNLLVVGLVCVVVAQVLLFVRSSLLVSSTSKNSDKPLVWPEWLMGPPTCVQDGFHCEQCNAVVWESLEKLRQQSTSAAVCDPSEVIGCDLFWPTGLGHHVHHIGHCLTLALLKEKPVVLLDGRWKYGEGCAQESENGKRFSCFFEHFGSLTCRDVFVEEARRSLSVLLRTADGEQPSLYSSYEPSLLSSSWTGDKFASACSHHPNPALAFKAAVLRFGFRLNGRFRRLLQAAAQQMSLRRPYAALHVRRGDKIGREAEFHPLREYLLALDQLTSRSPLAARGQERLMVFVSSDDPLVFKEAQRDFGARYEFVRLAQASELADEYHNPGSTKQTRSTELTLMDIAFLADCDFLVGTFSSQISRLAFELMTSKRGYIGHVYRRKPEKAVEQRLLAFNSTATQFRYPKWFRPDAPLRVASLDSFYYYGYQ